ncbi:CRISPR-associated protein Csx20 [Caldicellulosiruptoraceae bacterium PP1]
MNKQITSMFLIFSHELTQEQIDDAKKTLGVEKFIKLPGDIQEKWSNIPPNIELSSDFFKDLTNFLLANKTKVNYCLVQGDFGATHYIVNWCFKNGFTPIYSTTERKAVEHKNEDGSLSLIKVFKHVMFRRYINE